MSPGRARTPGARMNRGFGATSAERLLVGRRGGDPSQGEARPISDGPPLHHAAPEVVVDPDRLDLVAVPHLERQEAGEAQLPDAAIQLEGGGGPEDPDLLCPVEYAAHLFSLSRGPIDVAVDDLGRDHGHVACGGRTDPSRPTANVRMLSGEVRHRGSATLPKANPI